MGFMVGGSIFLRSFYIFLLVKLLRDVHCCSSLSRRTFRGEPKRGCSFRKKKFDFPLDQFLRKRLNERPFPLHGGASISKFFDSHLICAIDTVSVQYNKTFTYSEPASNGFYFSCGFCLGKNLSKNCTKKNSSAKESVHCGREPKFGSSGFRTLFRISF